MGSQIILLPQELNENHLVCFGSAHVLSHPNSAPFDIFIDDKIGFICVLTFHYTANDLMEFFGDKEINGGWTETDVPWDNPNARKAASVSNIEYTRDELFLFLGTEIEYKIKRFRF